MSPTPSLASPTGFSPKAKRTVRPTLPRIGAKEISDDEDDEDALLAEFDDVEFGGVPLP